MTKETLTMCHEAVGQIQAKNSQQAMFLYRCLAELEAEMRKTDGAPQSENTIVMRPTAVVPKKEGGEAS